MNKLITGFFALSSLIAVPTFANEQPQASIESTKVTGSCMAYFDAAARIESIAATRDGIISLTDDENEDGLTAVMSVLVRRAEVLKASSAALAEVFALVASEGSGASAKDAAQIIKTKDDAYAAANVVIAHDFLTKNPTAFTLEILSTAIACDRIFDPTTAATEKDGATK